MNQVQSFRGREYGLFGNNQVRLLGPMEWSIHGQPISLGSAKHQAALARLLLTRDHRASLQSLVEAIWDDDPPGTALKQVRNSVSDLRAFLTGTGATIVAVCEGYHLLLPPDSLDVPVFNGLVQRGRADVQVGAVNAAREKLTRALAMWRGLALANVMSPSIRAMAARLDDARLTAYAELIDLELLVGNDVRILPDLHSMVQENPLHEGLAARLMVVLYASGMRHRALEVYADIKLALTTRLGIEPGTQLRRLHHEIISDNDVNLGRVRPDLRASPSTLRFTSY